MSRFEERLAQTVASVMGLALLGGAGTGCAKDGDIDVTGMCDGEPGPSRDYFLREGFVEVAPGEACPDASDAQLKVHGCDFDEWQGVTCGFVRKDENQVLVDNGYGGYFENEADAPTGTGLYAVGPVVDVCFYEGVFWDDPSVSTTCGRPLLSEGQPVVAPVLTSSGPWSDGERPTTHGLSAKDRGLAADYWLRCGVLEHASVASFSEVSLDLLRLGAPPALVRGVHEAALDEITHAQLCFALASGYAGESMAPGPLPNREIAARHTRGDVAEALVREGCIGETLAAVDAAARLAVARDPAVRAALSVIVTDESEHAALAWRTLRWLLETDEDGSVRARVGAVFLEERARWQSPPKRDDTPPVSLRHHGLIGASERSRQLLRAWDEVIGPSWTALSEIGRGPSSVGDV